MIELPLGHGTTVFTIGDDPRLIQLEWKGNDKLVIRYPKDSGYPPNFVANHIGTRFKWSASRTRQTTINHWRRCRQSRKAGSGEVRTRG